MKQNLYIFGWPSNLGGADTKLTHLLDLLYDVYNITLIPNFKEQLQQKEWLTFLNKYKINYCLIDDLPNKLEGIALSLCNDAFFKNKIHKTALLKGLKIVWSSEMMWMHHGEKEAIDLKEIDKLLYVSSIQKSKLNYESFTDIPTSITGNYINPKFFPFKKRENEIFTIGRLSRPDPDKYSENFPQFYEYVSSDITNVKFRIMAWSEALKQKYKWHVFNNNWELLNPNQESQINFLNSLDVFLYPLGHKFIESWGRSTVEAMLTGAIPIVQNGHNLEKLIINNETGFICDDPYETKQIINMLYNNKEIKNKISKNCNDYAKNVLCNRNEHIAIWKEALDV